MSGGYQRLNTSAAPEDIINNSTRDRFDTEEETDDLAQANYSLQSQDVDQQDQITLQQSMQSALLDDNNDQINQNINDINNNNNNGSGMIIQKESQFVNNNNNDISMQQHYSHPGTPSKARPIVLLNQSNALQSQRSTSLIANPYISIDKQAAREKQAKQQQSSHMSSREESQQSGSIQAPTPPTKLVRTYSPYTPRGAVMLIQDKIQPGSIKGSIFNIIISTVGGGTLSLPYGIRYFGLVGGLVLLVLSGMLSYHSNDLMLVVCDNMSPNIKPSFKTMSELAGGKKLAIFTQVVLLTQMFGGYVSYLVAAGGLLDLAYSVYFPHGNIYIYAVLGMVVVIMFPLSLLNSMSKLRFTSLLGITCSSYLCVVLFVEYFLQCDHAYSEEFKWNGKYLPHDATEHDASKYNTCFWDVGKFYVPHAAFPFTSVTDFFTSFLTSFPLFVFSFTCNQYMLPIYVELQRRSRRRMQKVLRRGFSIITVMYIFASFGGFMSFLFATCGDIILNNYRKHADVVIAAIAISTSMILTNPITMFAWRQNFSLLIWHHREPLSRTKHLTVTIVFTLAATIIALLVTDIAKVFGLLGATTYPTIGFVLPGIFFIKLVPNVPRYKWKRRLAWFMTLFVGISSMAAFVYQIYTFIKPPSDSCHYMQKIEGPDW